MICWNTQAKGGCVQQSLVYVVDDDPDARAGLVSIVESMRLKVLACSNAEEFLAVVEENRPCCLVTDLRMGGMSGLEVLQHLKDSGRAIPTIMITGYAETTLVVDAMHAGAVTFLEKSAPQYKICEAISRALSLSQHQFNENEERKRVKQIWVSMKEDERKILHLVAQGKLNKEIAAAIESPLRTIEDRRRRLMTKVGATSIVDLVRFAINVEQLAKQGQIELQQTSAE